MDQTNYNKDRTRDECNIGGEKLLKFRLLKNAKHRCPPHWPRSRVVFKSPLSSVLFLL